MRRKLKCSLRVNEFCVASFRKTRNPQTRSPKQFTIDHRLWTFIFLSLISSLVSNVFSQDIHFSQFYAAPLTLNPAQTGFFDGQYRIGANYRNQWRSLPVPFNTASVFADFGLLKGKFKAGNWLGAGVLFMHDRAGDGELTTAQLMASVAYHQSLGTEKAYLSLGVQGGMMQRDVDFSEFYYDNQWNDILFDRTAASGENLSAQQEWRPDLSAGLMLSFLPSKSATVFLGGAVRHIIKPDDSFSDSGNQWGLRPVVSAGAQVKAGEHLSIEPAAVFMMQKKAVETVLGTLVGYSLSGSENDKGTIYLGIHGRISDALIFPVGYKIKNARLLFSYDVNLSSMKDASQSKGAFEFSLVYAGGKKPSGGNKMMPCPRL